jgi:phage-related protein
VITLPAWISTHRGDGVRSTFWLVKVGLSTPIYVTDCDQPIVYDGHTFASAPLSVDGLQADEAGTTGNGGRLAIASGGSEWRAILAAIAGGSRAFEVTVWEAWLDPTTLPSAVPPANAVRLAAVTKAEAAEGDAEWLTLTLGPSASPSLGRLPFREYSDSCTYRRFKGPQCGYTGSDTTCERTWAACTAKSNTGRFGGFYYSGGVVGLNAADEYVAVWDWVTDDIPYTGTVTFRLRGQ